MTTRPDPAVTALRNYAARERADAATSRRRLDGYEAAVRIERRLMEACLADAARAERSADMLEARARQVALYGKEVVTKLEDNQ